MSTTVSNSAYDSQASFRAVMDAMARPGEVRALRGSDAPAPLARAAAALVQSLADYETPIWLDTPLAVPAVKEWIRFSTGAPIVDDKRAAAFALIADPVGMPDFAQFALGSDEYPDRSATVIVQVARFGGEAVHIAGPGIKGRRTFAAEPLPPDFEVSFANNHALFPCGVDVILVANDQIVALPRSIRLLKGL